MQDDDIYPVSISMLNDYLYCDRRCALHQLDSLWQDNAYTLSGSLAHQRADDAGYMMTAEGARVERAMPLFADSIGLVGKADIVEFWPGPQGDVPLPVDYKLGKRRRWDNDDAQLCAQALCLEEMLGVAVPEGAIYHVKTRRRRKVIFTPQLRQLTLRTVDSVRKLLTDETLPSAVRKLQCGGCSLRDLCLPELTQDGGRISVAHRALFTPEGCI